jgi:hypothetical protein
MKPEIETCPYSPLTCHFTNRIFEVPIKVFSVKPKKHKFLRCEVDELALSSVY